MSNIETKKLYSNLLIQNIGSSVEPQILFLKRAPTNDFCPDKWCLPGGHIEPYENPDTAALREAHEETGLNFIGQLRTDYVHTHQDQECVCFYYSVNIDDPARYGVVHLDMNEHSNYVWKTPLDAITNLDLMLDLADQLKIIYFKTR